MQLGQRELHGAKCGLLIEAHHRALLGERRQQQLHLIAQPRHRVKHAARKHERERLGRSSSSRVITAVAAVDQLVGGAIQNPRGDHVAFVSRLLHVLRHGRDRPRAQLLVIDLVNQVGGPRARRNARAAAA